MLYRSKTERVLCPVICIATLWDPSPHQSANGGPPQVMGNATRARSATARSGECLIERENGPGHLFPSSLGCDQAEEDPQNNVPIVPQFFDLRLLPLQQLPKSDRHWEDPAVVADIAYEACSTSQRFRLREGERRAPSVLNRADQCLDGYRGSIRRSAPSSSAVST